MALKTRYITLDDLREYAGIDLVRELGTTEKALAFLFRIETRMESFLDARMFQKVDQRWPKFTDFQKREYKLALLEQCIYVWRNGDIAVDSGYDPEKGLAIDESSAVRLSIARLAKDHLMRCGLWSYKLKPYGGLSMGEWLW